MARSFEWENCVLQKEVKCRTVRLLRVDASEGSSSALSSEVFAMAIDSSANTPHAGWKSMLSGESGTSQPPNIYFQSTWLDFSLTRLK